MTRLLATTLLLLAAFTNADSELLHSSADITARTAAGTPVILQGEILRALGQDRYLLQDREGRIEITLPGKLTAGRVLESGSRLIISGQVAHTAHRPRVDADKLHSLKSAVSPAASTISY